MSYNFTTDNELLTCLEEAWPILCPDEQFEQFFQQVLNQQENQFSGPTEATVSALLGYSKALHITKASSAGIQVEVVLN